jgi:putative Holliday junction resolvase
VDVESKSSLPPGRILGVDYGSVRIGLAVSDPDRRIASPLTTYQRREQEADVAYFKNLIEREEITQIVVGLPIHLSGQEGEKAKESRKFGQWLGKATGLTRKRRRERIDRVAAQILLQSYIDAGCPKEIPSSPLDE